MSVKNTGCVLLADRHHGLAEGVRGLLDSVFEAVVMVADQHSLLETARRLHPRLAIVDISLPHDESPRWLQRLRGCCPELRIIVLSVHDEPSVCRSVMEAGADGFVLKRELATELLTAVDAVLAGDKYVSPGIAQPSKL